VPHQCDDAEQHRRRAKENPPIRCRLHTEKARPSLLLWVCGTREVIAALPFCPVSEKRGLHEFAYLAMGGLRTKTGSTPSAASQYSLKDLHVNTILNPHAATQERRPVVTRGVLPAVKGRFWDAGQGLRKCSLRRRRAASSNGGRPGSLGMRLPSGDRGPNSSMAACNPTRGLKGGQNPPC
jgi:hypothetical protein